MDGGKKAGAAGIGIMALLGGLAKGADDCGRAGLRAGSHVPGMADDVGRGIGKAPLRGLNPADDVGRGLGKTPLGGAPRRGFLPPAGGFGDEAAGVADDGLRLDARAVDDVRAPHEGVPGERPLAPGEAPGASKASEQTLEEGLAETGLEIAVELVPIEGGDEAEDESERDPPEAQPAKVHAYLGAPWLLALDVDHGLTSNSDHLVMGVSRPTSVADLEAAFAPQWVPLTLLAQSDAQGTRIRLAGSRFAPLDQVLLSCARFGSPCLVLACSESAPKECGASAARAWRRAALHLPPASEGPLSFGPVLATLLRELVRGLRATPGAKDAFVARLDRHNGRSNVVRTRPRSLAR
jgi:hypothetical protein